MRRHAPMLLAFTLLGGGCSTWRPVDLPTPLDSTFSVSGRIRLTDSSGVRHRTAYGASAVGPFARFRAPDWSIDSLPLTSIVRIERRQGDLGATIGFLAIVGLTAITTFIIVVEATGGMGIGFTVQ